MIRGMDTDEFRVHQDQLDGWCKDCDDFTVTGGVEPDAEGYKCPRCEGMSVMGADQAMLEGLIELE